MILAFVCNYKTYYMKAVSPANNLLVSNLQFQNHLWFLYEHSKQHRFVFYNEEHLSMQNQMWYMGSVHHNPHNNMLNRHCGSVRE